MKKEKVVYVSSKELYEGNGTLEKPYNNIETAINYLKGKTSENCRGMIVLRGGTYKVQHTIMLTGNDMSYIQIMPYENEYVEFTGVKTLNNDKFQRLTDLSEEQRLNQYSSWTRIPEKVQKNIWVYDLKNEGIAVGDIYKNGFNWKKRQPYAPDIICDGKEQLLACYPHNTNLEKNNIEVLYTGEKPRDFYSDVIEDETMEKTYEEMLSMEGPVLKLKIDDPSSVLWASPTKDESSLNVDNTKYETDAWFESYFGTDFALDMTKIISVSGKNEILYMKYPAMYSAIPEARNWNSKVINLLCELQYEQTYYIDRYNNNNVLYYYPKNGCIDNQKITITQMSAPLLSLEGVKEVIISGIHFNGTIDHGITLTNCEHCKIEDCEICSVGKDAIRIGDNNEYLHNYPEFDTFGGGCYNIVYNCLIHDCGNGGVFLAGGDRKSLTNGDNSVLHCEFYNLSKKAVYTPAVYLAGVHNSFCYNNVHDCPHEVIQIMGNNMTIEHNHLHNVCSIAKDMGPIYSGRDWTFLGNKIRYNYIDGVTSKGAYGTHFDDQMSGAIFTHNIIKNIPQGFGICHNSGFGHIMTNNVFIDVQKYVLAAVHGNANPKVTNPRWYSMLITKDKCPKSYVKKGFFNSAQNINKWYEEYNSDNKEYKYLFNLKDMWLPQEKNREADLTDPNCIEITGYNQLHHNIGIGNTSPSFDMVTVGLDPSKYMQLEADNEYFTRNILNGKRLIDSKDNYYCTSIDSIGLDLNTGKFADDSVLATKQMEEKGYGIKWIEEWNKNWNIKEIGLKK